MKKIITLLLTILLGLSLVGCNIVTKGDSAYDIAVKNGFKGTEKEWLESLKGSDGKSLNINDIYAEYKKDYPDVSFDEFLKEVFKNAELITGDSAYDIALKYGFVGTEEEWLASLKGERGSTGEAGKSIDLYAVYTKLVELGQYDKTYYEFVTENFPSSNDNFTLVAHEAMLSSFMVIASNSDLFSEELSDSDFVDTVSYGGAGVLYQLDKEKGDMYIITNFHVCYDETAKDILDYFWVFSYGQLSSSYAIEAKYIGGTATYDIAVLKVENSQKVKDSDYKEIKVIDSDSIHAGDTCFAIGSPASGLSITKGIISVDSENVTFSKLTELATDQAVRVIRIDAPVNHGNSGGGIFDDKGDFIGIVKAKKVTDQAENIGYAIPGNVAINLAKNIIENCDGNKQLYPKRCLMGITITPMNTKVIYEDGLLNIYDDVTVFAVSPGSIAEGVLQVDDVIKKLNFLGQDYDVTRNHKIVDICLLAKPGDVATLTIERDGVEMVVELTYGASIDLY